MSKLVMLFFVLHNESDVFTFVHYKFRNYEPLAFHAVAFIIFCFIL